MKFSGLLFYCFFPFFPLAAKSTHGAFNLKKTKTQQRTSRDYSFFLLWWICATSDGSQEEDESHADESKTKELNEWSSEKNLITEIELNLNWIMHGAVKHMLLASFFSLTLLRHNPEEVAYFIALYPIKSN